MIVILKKDVKGTGKAGEVVKVSPGYARNMLIPKGLAVEATEGNVRSLEKQKALQLEKEAAEKEEAVKLADKLSKASVEIKTKAGEGGRLFGSITNKDIAEEMEQQLGEKIDRRKISIDEPIKQLGTYRVEIKIYYDVIAKLSVNVMEEA